jgi:two-component system phosphate regulon response regulator PhoB
MRKKVLLVDDSLLILRMASAFLVREYDVVTAINGERALEKAVQEAPDLIVMDLNMPDHTGVEVARALRADARTRGIPVVIMTTDSELAAVPRGLDHLLKPFDGLTLLAKVARHLPDGGR